MPEPKCIPESSEILHNHQTIAEQNEIRPRSRLIQSALLVGGLALGAVGGVVAGVQTPTEATIAGQDTTIHINRGSKVSTADLTLIAGRNDRLHTSILGYPFSIGLRVNATPNAADNADKISERFIPAVLQSYSDIGHEAEKIQSAIESHIMHYLAGGVLVGLLLDGTLIYQYFDKKGTLSRMSPSARQEFMEARQPAIRRCKIVSAGLATTFALSSCALGTASYAYANDASPDIRPDPSFEDTPLAGTELYGAGKPVVKMAEKYIAGNDKYYNEVYDNFALAIDEYLQSHNLPQGKSILPVLMIADRHCNVGMDRVLGLGAKKLDVGMMVDAADDYFWSSLALPACTSGLAERAKSLHIKFETTVGNHDPHDSSNPAYDQGIDVINGVTTVNTTGGKLTLLSSPDPRQSNLGDEIQPNTSEEQLNAVTQQGAKLGEEACSSDTQIDLLIAHDSRAATTSIYNGCGKINFALSGHTHYRKLPQRIGINSYQYTEGTTGGATPDQPSYGPLKSDAYFSVLYYDTGFHTPIGIVYATIHHEDKSVDISEFQSLNGFQLDNNTAAQTQVPVINNG